MLPIRVRPPLRGCTLERCHFSPPAHSVVGMEVSLMKRSASATLVVAVCMAAVWTAAFIAPRAQSRRGNDQGHDQNDRTFDLTIGANARDLFARGRDVFRHDTFGDEHFWGD